VKQSAPDYSSQAWQDYRKAWMAARSGEERASINIQHRAKLWARGLRVLNITPMDRQLLKAMLIRWD
jgi:hypothetical protein